MPNLVANGGKVGTERARRKALAHVLEQGVRREQRGFATYTKASFVRVPFGHRIGNALQDRNGGLGDSG